MSAGGGGVRRCESMMHAILQVSVSCVERGRLMADLWTSHAELTGRVLTDLIQERSGSAQAVANMADENARLQDEAEGLRAKLRQRDLELADYKRRVERYEELSLKHKYKGETWEEQEAAAVAEQQRHCSASGSGLRLPIGGRGAAAHEDKPKGPALSFLSRPSTQQSLTDAQSEGGSSLQ